MRNAAAFVVGIQRPGLTTGTLDEAAGCFGGAVIKDVAALREAHDGVANTAPCLAVWPTIGGKWPVA